MCSITPSTVDDQYRLRNRYKKKTGKRRPTIISICIFRLIFLRKNRNEVAQRVRNKIFHFAIVFESIFTHRGDVFLGGASCFFFLLPSRILMRHSSSVCSKYLALLPLVATKTRPAITMLCLSCWAASRRAAIVWTLDMIWSLLVVPTKPHTTGCVPVPHTKKKDRTEREWFWNQTNANFSDQLNHT